MLIKQHMILRQCVDEKHYILSLCWVMTLTLNWNDIGKICRRWVGKTVKFGFDNQVQGLVFIK